jgi:3',5'-cyclic AMP phosphodiesterase CpdA
MKKIIYCIITLLIIITGSLSSQSLNNDIKFCVISDVHLYDTTLGIKGSAFQAYLMQDRKLLVESEPILRSAINIVKSEKPSFLLITGDLTKDGEKQVHHLLAKYLDSLKTAGIPSYVIPGNHDIANPDAMSFSGDTKTPVPSVTDKEFAEIYNDYGFSSAIARDDSSLSYIIEPAEGLWIFALDACRYKENTTTPIVGGRYSETTLEWIKTNLIKAKNQNKVVIGMMHHGILEHYTGQKIFFPDYVVDNYETVSKMFAQYGLNIVFTGHYHAQDITFRNYTAAETGGKAAGIYDIETGSLVTNPNPVRTVTLSKDLSMNIKTTDVTQIDFPTDTLTFPEYSLSYLAAGLNVLVPYILTLPATSGGYGLSADEAASVTPYFVQAFAAHYRGDEIPSVELLAAIQSFMSSSDPKMIMLGSALGTLWTDIAPADNNYIINNITTSVKHEDEFSQPSSLTLSQNYPNPFNPTTNIRFNIKEPGYVTLKVYDTIGREITTLTNEYKQAGEYNIPFNASSFASGVYYYSIKQGNKVLTKSMILVK